jgi:hypothetical protein
MMSDLRTILERGVGGATPPRDGFERMLHRRDRKRRNQRIVAGVVGIAVFVAAVWIVTTAGSFDRTTTPADQPTVSSAGAAAEVALGFLDAFAAFDAQKAMTYVADDADLRVIPQATASDKGLSLKLSLLEAVGYQQTITSCQASPFGSDTSVVCAIDLHLIRSDEIGRGPFDSNFVFTVRDGEIVNAFLNWNIERFLSQVWEPFAEWMSATYPRDFEVMFAEGRVRLTEESIRLWERHTREYVEEVKQGTA